MHRHYEHAAAQRSQANAESECSRSSIGPPVMNITHLVFNTTLPRIKPNKTNATNKGATFFLSTLFLPATASSSKLRKKQSTNNIHFIMVRDAYHSLRAEKNCSSTQYHHDILQLGSLQDSIFASFHYAGSLFKSLNESPMAKFLASPILRTMHKDPGDWNLHLFQEAVYRTCSNLFNERHLNANIKLDDLLLPERLCKGPTNQVPNTLTSMMRIGNLLQDSVEGHLPILEYVKPFSELGHMNQPDKQFIIVLDASLPGMEDLILFVKKLFNAARHSKSVLVLVFWHAHEVSKRQKNKDGESWETCSCPPASCLCMFS